MSGSFRVADCDIIMQWLLKLNRGCK